MKYYKSRSIQLILMSLLFSTLTFSCQKEEFQETDIPAAGISQQQQRLFYLDNTLVVEGTYNEEDNNLLFIYTTTNLNNPKDKTVQVRAFTSENGYLDFGLLLGVDLRNQLAFEHDIRQYMKDNNMEETADDFPDDFYQFEVERAQFYFGTETISSGSRSVWLQIYKNLIGGPARIVVLPTKSTLWWGWNNTIERIYPFGIGHAVTLFDKTFYRGARKTFVGWAGVYINLIIDAPYMNNRTSSLIRG